MSNSLKHYTTASVNLIHVGVFYDLMEQFLALGLNLILFAVAMSFIIAAVMLAQFLLTALFNKVAAFVASVLKDIAGADAFSFSRN
jgi:hypothetical protein